MREFIGKIVLWMRDLLLGVQAFLNDGRDALEKLWNTNHDFQYGTYVILGNRIAGWFGMIVGKVIGQTKDDFKKTKKPPSKN